MTGLVILAAVVAFVLYPSVPTAKGGGATPDVVRMVGRVAIVQLVVWAVVCVAMVAGLVTWAVLR